MDGLSLHCMAPAASCFVSLSLTVDASMAPRIGAVHDNKLSPYSHLHRHLYLFMLCFVLGRPFPCGLVDRE